MRALHIGVVCAALAFGCGKGGSSDKGKGEPAGGKAEPGGGDEVQPPTNLSARFAGMPVKNDIYGDPMPPGAIARLGTMRLRHGGAVNDLAVSVDGKTLVSVGADKKLRRWEIPGGKPLDEYGVVDVADGETNLAYALRGVAIAGDGRVAAAGSRFVRIWDATGKQVHRLEAGREGLGTLAFAEGGAKIVSVGAGAIWIWDTASGKRVRRIDVGEQITGAAIARDGSMVALATKDGGAALWSVAKGDKVASMGAADVGFESFAFSPDSTVVAGAGVDDKTICFWKLDGTLIGTREIDWKYARSKAMEFSPDGKTLAVAGQDRVFVYAYEEARPETSKLLHTLEGHDEYVYALRFTPNGAQLLSSGADSQIMIWDVGSGELAERPSGNDGSWFRAAITRDGTIAATSGGMDRVHVWKADTGELLHTLEAEHEHSRLLFTPDGSKLVTAGLNDVTVWNVATGEKLTSIDPGGVDAIAVSPDSKQLASIWARDGLTLFDAAGKKTVHEGLDEDADIYALQYLDATTLVWLDGKKRVMTMTTDGKPGTGAALTEAWIGTHPGPALSWDGKRAVVPTMASATVWDLNTGTQVHELHVNSGVTSAAFTPDGHSVLIGYDIPYRTDDDSERPGHTIAAYDVKSGKPWLELTAHGGEVIDFAVPETGMRFVSMSVDGTALVWDWSTMSP